MTRTVEKGEIQEWLDKFHEFMEESKKTNLMTEKE